jgi:UDPglucose--hexose-1-phosphate uridylyltransferase
VRDLSQDNRIAYISIFKNEGINAGATQEHSHTQIIGLPIIPKEQKDYYLRLYEHFKHNNNSLSELIISEEEQDKANRIIATHGDFIAFCPYASAHPFEIIISAKKSVGQINTLSSESIKTLAPLLLQTIKKLQTQLSCLDFNLSISTPPLHEGCVESEVIRTFDEASRFYIRIMPRIYKHGGFEQSTGIMINPVSPELAAKLLRES